MKIAIPLVEGRLASHFGQAKSFALISVDKVAGEIRRQEEVPAPPHQPGLLPGWLAEQGAATIFAGGMGRRAIDLFCKHNIEAIVGVREEAPVVLVEEYLQGILEGGGNACTH